MRKPKTDQWYIASIIKVDDFFDKELVLLGTVRNVNKYINSHAFDIKRRVDIGNAVESYWDAHETAFNYANQSHYNPEVYSV